MERRVVRSTLDKEQSRSTGPGVGKKRVDNKPALLGTRMVHSGEKTRLTRQGQKAIRTCEV